jgi:signal transduction histidine kinase
LIAALVRCCLVWLLAVWQLPGLAQPAQPPRDQPDHIVARAWLDDPASSFEHDQVRAMAWTPYTGPLRRGFVASTTWLRLKVTPPADRGQRAADRQTRLVLRMQPGHLDEIALFDPRYPDQPPQLAGDRHDWRLSEYRSFNQNLVIAAPSEPIEVLLRLRTSSHHGIHVEALHWDEAEATDRQQQLIVGAVIAFLLMVLAWAVTAWLQRRERVVGAFIVHQVVSVLFALSLLGFFRIYLSDWLTAQAIDRISSAMFPITAATVVWFHWHFLREFKPPRLGLRCLLGLAAALLLTLLMMMAGLMRQAQQLNTAITLLTPMLLLVLAWRTATPTPSDPPRLSRRHLIGIYSLMLMVLSTAALPAMGWMPSPPWAMYSAIAYGLISAAMLFGALRARARHAASARRKVQTDLVLAEQLVTQERERRREQEQFMTMLTHELTNALATAHLAIGSLSPASPMRGRGYRAIDSMRNIITRCALSGELETANPVLQVAAVNVLALLQELRHQLPAGASIALNTDTALPDCATDRQLLGVILSNLLDNALKYRAEAGVVEVTASPQSRGARPGLQLSVSNAPGDAGRPDPEQLFKKYWRGAGATRHAGSGLGLYLSSLIARRLGGELRYQPEMTDVRFVLWLPI